MKLKDATQAIEIPVQYLCKYLRYEKGLFWQVPKTRIKKIPPMTHTFFLITCMISDIFLNTGMIHAHIIFWIEKAWKLI